MELGHEWAFATVERSSGRVIGSTRLMNIHRVKGLPLAWIALAGFA